MRISVIIPTHNRASTLQNTLSALARQTLSRDEFEVIVVDDGSDDSTRAELRKYRAPYDFALIEKEQGGLASARNRGADRASGEILHFLDDDVLPDPRLLDEHRSTHASQAEPVAVVGALPYPPHVRINSFLWYLERSGHYDLYKHPGKYPGGRPPMPPMNGNSSIRRDVFVRVGKYDESFRRYGSEDLDLGFRLARAGVRFVYNPRAIGYHDHVKDFNRFCRDMEIAGESLIDLYRRYPEIKSAKKIDILLDPIGRLPGKKKVVKTILFASFAAPWLLQLPRWLIRRTESMFALRHVLFPLYRWIAHYHYAVGMRRGLSAYVHP